MGLMCLLQLQDALPHLEELYLIDNYMMALIAEPTALKNLSRFVIKGKPCITGGCHCIEFVHFPT